MIMLQRKLKCKWNGDEKYLPDNFHPDKFVPVIGWEVKKREMRREKNGSQVIEVVEDVYYQVIDNKGRLASVPSFNVQTMIDDTEEKMFMAIAQNTGALAEIVKESSCDGTIVIRTVSNK